MKIRNFLMIGVMVFTTSQVKGASLFFENYTVNEDDRARVYLPSLGFLGSNYVAELFWAPGVVSDPRNLTYLGSADTRLGVYPFPAGYFNGNPIVLPGGVVTLAIDVDRVGILEPYSVQGSYDGGLGNSTVRGYFTLNGSELFQLTIPESPADIVWLDGLTWNVPEPSSLSLALLAGGLAAMRRRIQRGTVITPTGCEDR